MPPSASFPRSVPRAASVAAVVRRAVQRSARFAARGAVVAFVGTALAATLSGGEVRLKNGSVLTGKPVPILGLTTALVQQSAGNTTVHPMLMVDAGMQRYIVGARQVAEINRSVELSREESFEVPQKISGRKQMLKTVGAMTDRTVFDEFGRRRVTFRTAEGPLHVIQGITKIGPHRVRVTGLTHVWDHEIATTSIDPPVLDSILRHVTDRSKPADRMAVASFYTQAGRWPEADVELAGIAKDFPELRARAEELQVGLRQLWAQELLDELKRRLRVGQHELALQAATSFPRDKMGAAVLRQIDEILADSTRRRERLDEASLLVGDLHAQLSDRDLSDRLGPMRTELRERLDLESLDRLEPFLRLSIDPQLSPAEKLSLAYSGWILGSAGATTEIRQTVALWDARFLVRQFLRSVRPDERTDLVEKLGRLEGVGPERIRRLIPQLEPWVETPGIRPGAAHRIEVPAGSPGGPLTYEVLLPEEYSPHHAYPLVVALRPAERTLRDMLDWWGVLRRHEHDPGIAGQSQRRGYVVIAPQYVPEKTASYVSSSAVHAAVEGCLRDACRRFSIDSDRVFLSGHGMGGDAAFDLGMSHPHLWAGVVPIAGICDGHTKWYWENCRHLGWYVVGGELDRDQLDKNARDLSRMMRYGHDVTYVEYVGRGYESFYEEIHAVFEWMDRHRRSADPKEVEMLALRPTESRFYWYAGTGIPAKILEAAAAVQADSSRTAVRPLTLAARITAGNSVDVRSGTDRHDLWLSPELVDFERRVTVRVNGRQRFNDFLRPDVGTLLEDLRLRADRQRTYVAHLAFD